MLLVSPLFTFKTLRTPFPLPMQARKYAPACNWSSAARFPHPQEPPKQSKERLYFSDDFESKSFAFQGQHRSGSSIPITRELSLAA
jgi:hypothetical protein